MAAKRRAAHSIPIVLTAKPAKAKFVWLPAPTPQRDCAPGEVCAQGINTELNVCQAAPSNITPNNTTNITPNNTTNISPNNLPTTYIAARVQSEATGDEACAITDPGPDIYAIGLEDTGGAPLGWGRHVSNAVQFDGNDHVDTSHLDGSAPGLDADLCPDQFDGNVVALGCDAESWLTVEFIDDGGKHRSAWLATARSRSWSTSTAHSAAAP